MTAPAEVWFYHLERSSVEQALPELLERTLARGWRAVVRAPDAERLKALDEHLWAYRADAFLPHGCCDQPGAERQPVLLTTGEGAVNGPQAAFLLDDAEAGELDGVERVVLLFDGGRDEAVQAARRRWSAFRRAGHPVSYWKQEGGRWSKTA